MGTPTGANIVYPDGREEYLNDPAAALLRIDHGRVEYAYSWSADSLPDDGGPLSLWRYRDLLPLDDGPIRYPLAIGGTPLNPVPGVRELLGFGSLWLKDETRTPTGSNKDRATALVLEHALREDRPVVSCASTGNVAVSLAVGAAAARRRAVIFVPVNTAESKLTLMQLAGARVLKVRQGYEAAFELSRRAASEFGWYDRNTGFNPLTLEAKKTVAFEIWEQLGRRMPDVAVSPVGDGVTLSALAKGFREIVHCGLAERVPRIIGVQAEGCQPVARAWRSGSSIEPSTPDTLADGIAVEMPISGRSVLRDVRESGGDFVTVSDEQLVADITELASHSGLLAEPAGVSGYAGMKAALEQGLITRDETIAVLVTGTLFKNLGYARPSFEAHEIDAEIDDVRRVVEGH